MKKKLAIAWLAVVGMGILWLVVAIVREALRGSTDARLAIMLIGIAVAALLTFISATVLGQED